MKRVLEYTRNEWKGRFRTFICNVLTLCRIVFWFLKARSRTFACCMLALCFLLLVFTDSAFAKTVTVDAQGWADYHNIWVIAVLAEERYTILI